MRACGRRPRRSRSGSLPISTKARSSCSTPSWSVSARRTSALSAAASLPTPIRVGPTMRSGTADMADTLPGILAIFNNVASGREAEFEEWFQHEHLAERIAVPGFLLGRRHEAVSGQPRFFNFYLVQSVEVLNSAAYLGRLDTPTPMTRVIMSEVFKDMIRTVCHRVYRLGAMRGTGVVTVRFAERPAEAVLKAA